MKKLRVLSILGTRPEAIKMCPLVKELSTRESIESLCCVTGQHREMLDSVLDVFQIKPDYDLNIMTPNQTLAHATNPYGDGYACKRIADIVEAWWK